MSYRPSNPRLQELLDQIRAEFENVKHEASTYRLHKDESDHKFNQQASELQKIRQTVFDLETAHRSMKEAYDQEILRLKAELESRDRQLAQIQAQQSMGHDVRGGPNGQIGPPNVSPATTAPSTYGASAPKNSYYSPSSAAHQIPPPKSQLPGAPSNGTPKQNSIQIPPPPGPGQYPGPQRQVSGSQPPPPQVAQQAPPQVAQQAPPQVAQPPPSQQVAQPPAAAAAQPQPPASQQHTPQPQRSELQQPGVGTPGLGHEMVKMESYTVPANQKAAHKKMIPPFLKDLDSQSVPQEMKKQHSEYYVLYNPSLTKKIDVELLHSLEHSSVVCCVRFSADGKYLATGCNKTTQVYSVETGEIVAQLVDNNVPNGSNATDGTAGSGNGGDLYIRSVCFSPDGKFLATGAEDKLIRIWDLTTRRITKYLKGHEQDIYSLDFFPDGRKLISGSGDRTVRIWDLTSGLTQLTLTIEDGVTTVAVSPDGKLIAAGSLDRTVRVWDAITGFLVERLDSENENDNGHKDSVYSVIFTGNGKEIASGSLDTTVKLWSLNGLNAVNKSNSNSNCEVTYVGHKDFVLSVCASPKGDYILSGSKDRGVIFWEKTTGDPLLMLQGHRNSVISVSVSNNPTSGSGIFATGSGDCKARIWKWTEY